MSVHVSMLIMLTVVVNLFASILVGRARGKYSVHAPAIAGHPVFDRTFRAHQNTIEHSLLFIPLLWLAANYGFENAAVAAGYTWIVARVLYVIGYIKQANKRQLGFAISYLALISLLGMSLWGITVAMVK